MPNTWTVAWQQNQMRWRALPILPLLSARSLWYQGLGLLLRKVGRETKIALVVSTLGLGPQIFQWLAIGRWPRNRPKRNADCTLLAWVTHRRTQSSTWVIWTRPNWTIAQSSSNRTHRSKILSKSSYHRSISTHASFSWGAPLLHSNSTLQARGVAKEFLKLSISSVRPVRTEMATRAPRESIISGRVNIKAKVRKLCSGILVHVKTWWVARKLCVRAVLRRSSLTRSTLISTRRKRMTLLWPRII